MRDQRELKRSLDKTRRLEQVQEAEQSVCRNWGIKVEGKNKDTTYARSLEVDPLGITPEPGLPKDKD